jgi:hypothetical protein
VSQIVHVCSEVCTFVNMLPYIAVLFVGGVDYHRKPRGVAVGSALSRLSLARSLAARNCSLLSQTLLPKTLAPVEM